jgi:hypothetical protein
MLECFSLLYFNILFTNNQVKIRLLPQQNLICYLFELFNVQPIKFNQGGKINQLGFWCFILNTRRGTSPFNEQILWFTNIFFNENIWSVFDLFFFFIWIIQMEIIFCIIAEWFCAVNQRSGQIWHQWVLENHE